MSAGPSAGAETTIPRGPRAVDGWPVVLGHKIRSAATVADLNNDGMDEIAVGLLDGQVFLLDAAGRPLPGWPQSVGSGIFNRPLICDLDKNGRHEIIVSSLEHLLHGWHSDGSRLPGWPVDLRVEAACAPELVILGDDKHSAVAVAGRDGWIHLLDINGRSLPGWPKLVNRQHPHRYDTFPLKGADLDGDGAHEIIFVSHVNPTLYAWTHNGNDFPGFPVRLNDYGKGVDVDNSRSPARIACTTSHSIYVFDTRGRQIHLWELSDEQDRFSTAPVYFDSKSPQGINNRFLAAATRNGLTYLWDDAGKLMPGWPVRIGGFIYGRFPSDDKLGIEGAPCAWDVDGDGVKEILISSYNQHLYCFDISGQPVSGWPLILDDIISASPSFGQLDGAGRKEMIIGNSGESLFAFHLDLPEAARLSVQAQSPDLDDTGKWPVHYSLLTGLILCMLLLLVYHQRRQAGLSTVFNQLGVAGNIVLILIVALILVRVFNFISEYREYRLTQKHIQTAARSLDRVIDQAFKHEDRLSHNIASALDSAGFESELEPMQLLPVMERLADNHRLDFAYDGLITADSTGRVIQALGLARGWEHLADLDLRVGDRASYRLMETMPVIVSQAPFNVFGKPYHLLLISSLLKRLPQSIADATGYSAHIRLNRNTLAWGGVTKKPSSFIWPWLGFIEPSLEIPLFETSAGDMVTIKISDEGFIRPTGGWLSIAILITLPVFYFLVSFRRGGGRLKSLPWWWPVAFGCVYAAGLLSFSRAELAQRPVPLAGHVLEFLLQLVGFLGISIILRTVIGNHRLRRLNFALLGSYLIVAILPLAFVLGIINILIQKSQQELILNSVQKLEQQADHLTLAYAGSPAFYIELSNKAEDLFDMPPGWGFFDFVGYDENLFNYDLPSAYLTLWACDRDDPERYLSGYSWRAPRTEKFFPKLPDWSQSENQKGVFVDRGEPYIRATRTLRHYKYDIELVCHIRFDRSVIVDLEEQLRISSLLPRVRLQPTWHEPSSGTDSHDGWLLPFTNQLTLPARDWRTGAPRWVILQARAFLPSGRSMWPVLMSMIFIAAFPLALSVWGVYFTFRRTVGPMVGLLKGIRRVEMGDLDYRLASSGQSEIALTSRAFDRMAGSLQANIRTQVDKKKLEELNELKTQFISMVSHDLKTPLASIKGASENILAGLTGPVSEKQRRYIEMIVNSSKNLQHMITNLLDLSRLESGNIELNFENIDTKREIENILRSMASLLDASGIETAMKIDSDHTIIQADRTRFWQIFNNILSNSVRVSPAQGRIEVYIENGAGPPDDPKATLNISVLDEGPGITDSEAQRLFEPFYSRPRGSREKPGSGLGLAIVKQLVELHGGRAEITNRPEGGSRFMVSLPRFQPDR